MKAQILKRAILALMMAVTAATASAYDFEVDGICYNKLSDGKSVEVAYSSSYSGSVTIPSQVTYSGTTYAITSIGIYALNNCTGLTSVTIPNSVTSIGYRAFLYCSGLTSVTIGNSVTLIGSEAFYGCTGLTSVTIPNSVTSIGSCAFCYCSGLTTVTIPNSVTSIGASAFYGCSGLIKSAYPDRFCDPFGCGVQVAYPSDGVIDSDGTIYNKDKTSLFFVPYDVAEFNIPGTVTTIRSKSFAKCSKLTTLTIPASVTSIWSNSFDGCTGLTSVTFNAKNCAIDSDWLSDAKFITKFEIGPEVGSIPNYLCSGMSELTSITIPNTVTSIGKNAFYGCSGLTSVTIPNSVTSIGSYAFAGCNLSKVIWLSSTPPSGYNGVKALVHYVVNEQYSLDNQFCYPFLSSMFTIDGIVYVPISPQDRTCDVIDCSYLPDYKSVVISEKVNYKGIDMSIIDIKPYSFYNNYNIESVEISNTGNVGDYTFYGCTALQSATISNTGNVGDHAFYGCTALQSATISNTGNVGDYAFYGCTALQSATISNTGNVGDHAFYGCTALQYATISNTGNIEDHAFYGCTALQAATITNTGNIGDLTFYGCSKLQSVNIGDQVTAIGNWAFSGCSAMEYISLGSNVERIGEEAFSDCSGLTNFTSNAGVPPTCGSQALDDINKWKCTLYVPTESIEQYKVADHWKDFFFIEELGIEDIVVDDDNADCPIEVYSIQGVKVGDSTDGLAPGTYIVKQGCSITKQVIQ